MSKLEKRYGWAAFTIEPAGGKEIIFGTLSETEDGAWAALRAHDDHSRYAALSNAELMREGYLVRLVEIRW